LWIAKTDGEASINITYQISLCSEIPKNGGTDNGCAAGTSICMTFPNGTARSAGNFTTEKDEIPGQHNEDIGESWLAFAGDKCLQDPVYNLTTLINIKCGLTMVCNKHNHLYLY